MNLCQILLFNVVFFDNFLIELISSGKRDSAIEQVINLFEFNFYPIRKTMIFEKQFVRKVSFFSLSPIFLVYFTAQPILRNPFVLLVRIEPSLLNKLDSSSTINVSTHSSGNFNEYCLQGFARTWTH